MPFQLQARIRDLGRYRSTRITSEGLQFLFFTLAVGIAAINTGNNLFYLLLAMMLSIILMSGIVAEFCVRRLEFNRHLPELLFANETALASLLITNRKTRIPSFSLRLFDVCRGHDLDRGLALRQLPPGSSQLLSYPVIAKRRGLMELDGIYVVTTFPFGLFAKKAYYPARATAVVCPEIKPIPDHIFESLRATGRDFSVHRRGYGNDLYNLRLYQPGDDSRNIHWTTTAKTSKLIVRETEAEDQHRATIQLSLLAPDSHDAMFEDALAFTASLLCHLARGGYAVRLIAGASSSPFGQSESHLIDLLRELALCERRQPDAPVEHREDLSTEQVAEHGVLIVVRPWPGANIPVTDAHTLLVDETTFAEPSHVV